MPRLTKTQIEIDFNLNALIRNDVDEKRKFHGFELTKERAVGIMVEDHCKLIKVLDKNGMTLEQLLISLKKSNESTINHTRTRSNQE